MAKSPIKKSVESELLTTDTPPVPAALPPLVPPRKKAPRPARVRKTAAAHPAAAATSETSRSGATATDNLPTAAAGSPTQAPADRLNQIFDGLKQKSTAKQAIFRNALAAFDCLRLVSQELVVELTRKLTPLDSSVVIDYRSINDMEFHIRFSGD